MQTAQARMVENYNVGSMPGPMAVVIGSGWIAYVVATRAAETKFPRWFNLFNPLVTMLWVAPAS